MEYYNNVLELIGNTPLLKLNNVLEDCQANVFAKLEFYNPGGSIKDRMACHILERAEKDGKLKPGYTIIEATAGNTGIGLALAALNRGYQVVFVVPGKFSQEKQDIMEALGAKIVRTPTASGLQGAFEQVSKLARQIGTAFVPDQFTNEANPEAHYKYTGPELFRQLEGEIDYLVAGAGSGGTLTGIMRYLRETNTKAKGVMVDPVGSIMGGGKCSNYRIEGIGNDFIPKTLDKQYVDQVIKVTDEEAFMWVRKLASKEGLLVGSSSGAAMAGVEKLLAMGCHGNVVVIFPDRADRYLSQGIYK